MGHAAILIRHAESSGHTPDAGLTARGVAQARELSVALRGESITTVVTSPYRRARETAEPLAERVEVRIDHRLAEWELPWIPPTEWPQALGRVFSGDLPLPADVEPRQVAQARALAALQEAETSPGGVVGLVTHGKLLALLLEELTGTDAFAIFVTLRNPHAFAVSGPASRREVRSLWHPSI